MNKVFVGLRCIVGFLFLNNGLVGFSFKNYNRIVIKNDIIRL